jgi:hypothetical protein
VVEEKDVSVRRCRRASYFLQLARANQDRGIGPVAPLQNLAHNLGSSTFGERAKFGDRLIRIEFRDAWLAIGFWQAASRRLHRGGFSRHRSLRRDYSLRPAAATRADVDAYQKGPLAIRFRANDFRSQGHTPAQARRAAGFLGVRTSQTENALSFGAGA